MFVTKSARIFTIPAAKPFRKETNKEKLFLELKPSLQVSQIFGLAPVSIRKGKWIFCKAGLAYSALCFVIVIYLFTDRILISIEEKWELKLKILYITTVASTGSCVFADGVGCLLGNKKLQGYINYIQRFDALIKDKNESTATFVKWYWKILMGLSIFLLAITGTTYAIDKKPLLGALSYFMFCATLTIGLLKFLTFVMAICIRFWKLNSKLIKDLSIVLQINEKNQSFNWQEIWKKHTLLIEASKKLNAKYSFQLLFWFTILSLNSILQIFELIKIKHNVIEKTREFILASFFILLLVALTTVCHFTSKEAKQLGKLLSSPEYCQLYNFHDQQIMFSVAQYSQLNDFNFSAFGLFNINLPVLLSIGSAITTYLVILM